MASRAKRPFYQVVTKVATPGAAGPIDLPLVTLPPGTVLFRALKLPDPNPYMHYDQNTRMKKREEQILLFYRDFLGDPLPDGTVCLLPTHNTFFYPFPFVGFGLHDIGTTFTMIVAYVLVHPVTVVCAISPSDFVRGQGQRYGAADPWARCNIFPYRCKELNPAQEVALEYDNCLQPEYQVSSGTRGWMALADLDSFEPRKLKKRSIPGKNAPMSRYIRELNARNPGLGKQLLTWSYKDDHQHAGFPEIAMFPYYNHPGPHVLKRPCNNERMAQRLLQQEVRNNNLNYLPLAIFTKLGAIDMTTGFYDVGRLALNTPDFFTLQTAVHQRDIEQHMNEWLQNAFSVGLKLPFYKEGKLAIDSRTGFLVLPQMVPTNLQITLPPAVIAADKAAIAAGAAAHAAAVAKAKAEGKEPPKDPKSHDTVPYKFLCLPMDTPQAQKRALQYILLFRTYIPGQFMVKYDKDKTGLRRAMIFNRPGVLSDVFKTVGIEMPKEFGKTLYNAGKLYQAETGIKPKGPKGAAAAASAEQVLHVTGLPPGTTMQKVVAAFGRYNIASIRAQPPGAAFLTVRGGTPAADIAAATDRKLLINGALVNVAVARPGAFAAASGATENAAALMGQLATGAGGAAAGGYEPRTPEFGGVPAVAAVGDNEGGHTPRYGGESPVYNATVGDVAGAGGNSPRSPGYGSMASVLASENERRRARAAAAAAEAGGAGGPKTPEFRRAVGGGGTRRRHRTHRASTRKHEDPLRALGKNFASLWKLHGKHKA